MPEKNKNDKPIKTGLGKFAKIIVLILVITLAIYFIIDTVEYGLTQKNNVQNTENFIEKPISNIESESSGDIMPEV